MLPTGMKVPQIQEKVAEIIEKANRVERKPLSKKSLERQGYRNKRGNR